MTPMDRGFHGLLVGHVTGTATSASTSPEYRCGGQNLEGAPPTQKHLVPQPVDLIFLPLSNTDLAVIPWVFRKVYFHGREPKIRWMISPHATPAHFFDRLGVADWLAH